MKTRQEDVERGWDSVFPKIDRHVQFHIKSKIEDLQKMLFLYESLAENFKSFDALKNTIEMIDVNVNTKDDWLFDENETEEEVLSYRGYSHGFDECLRMVYDKLAQFEKYNDLIDDILYELDMEDDLQFFGE